MERKSLVDLVSSLTSGKLCYQVADLAALPRAAVVVEDRYSQLFKLDRVRPAVVADGLAELQIRWPNVPIVFCETRLLAEEWTYRFLAAAHLWAITEHAALQRISPTRIDVTELHQAAAAPEPSTAEVRAWAHAIGLPVPDRGSDDWWLNPGGTRQRQSPPRAHPDAGPENQDVSISRVPKTNTNDGLPSRPEFGAEARCARPCAEVPAAGGRAKP